MSNGLLSGKSGVWSTGAIARGLGCSDKTVIAACNKGALPCHRVGRRHRRVLEVDLVSYVARQGMGRLPGADGHPRLIRPLPTPPATLEPSHMIFPDEPWLLDLFCGAGGAAMGYHRAGFNVVGVDHEPQPNYPFDFCEGDALELLERLLRGSWVRFGEAGKFYLNDFAAIHASPPCQRYSQGTKRWKGRAEKHPDLIGPVRDALERTGLPWIIENVVGAPLYRPITLCGTMFGLRVFRHRLFEASFLLLQPGHQKHDGSTGAHRGYSTARSGRNGFVCVAGHNFELGAASQAMGIDWVQTRAELCQMVPPTYTEFIGRQLLNVVG